MKPNARLGTGLLAFGTVFTAFAGYAYLAPATYRSSSLLVCDGCNAGAEDAARRDDVTLALGLEQAVLEPETLRQLTGELGDDAAELSPLEAAAFGRPAVVLRDGGYLDTVVENVTGLFFDAPEPHLVADALEQANGHPWNDGALSSHVEAFAIPRFVGRLREVVEEQRALLSGTSGAAGERDS